MRFKTRLSKSKHVLLIQIFIQKKHILLIQQPKNPQKTSEMNLYPDMFQWRYEEGFHCSDDKEAGSNYRDMTDVPTEELR